MHRALGVVDADDKDLNLVADLQDVLRLDRRVSADLVIGNVTGMLRTQVDLHFRRADRCDNACDLISCI